MQANLLDLNELMENKKKVITMMQIQALGLIEKTEPLEECLECIKRELDYTIMCGESWTKEEKKRLITIHP